MFIKHNTGNSPYLKKPIEALKDPAVLNAANTVLQYADNNRHKMRNMEGVFDDRNSGKNFTVRQAIDTAQNASFLADETRTNARIERMIEIAPEVGEYMDIGFKMISPDVIVNTFTKIMGEFEENMKLVQESPPTNPLEGILDMFVLYGDVADDVLMLLAVLLEENTDFASSLACQILGLFGMDNENPVFDLMATQLDMVSFVLKVFNIVLGLLKKITGALTNIGGFLDELSQTLTNAIKTAIMGMITYYITVNLKPLEYAVNMILNFSVKDMIQTIMNQVQSDLLLKNPRYIKKVVNESIDKALAGEVIPSYLEKYMERNLNVGNVQLDQTVQGPKNIEDYLPITQILKDMMFSSVFVIADILIKMIEQFFNFMTSSLADFEPPALLIKIDKAVGILTNLTGALSSISGSAADILSAMANCELFKDSDMIQYAFEQIFEMGIPDGELQKYNIEAGKEQSKELFERIKQEYMFLFDKFDITIEPRSGDQQTTTPITLDALRTSLKNYSGELSKIVEYRVIK